MKLSDRTRRVLENFASIKSSMRFVTGDIIATMTDGKSIVAQARVDEPIETEFAIGDLSQFLGIARLFSDPDLQVTGSKVTFVEGGKRASYTCSSLELVPAPPIKPVVFDIDARFALSSQMLKQVRDACATLKCPDVVVAGVDGQLLLKATTVSDPTCDTYSVVVGETDKSFSLAFDKQNIVFIPTDYEVELSFRGYARFQTDGLTYYVTADSKKSVVP